MISDIKKLRDKVDKIHHPEEIVKKINGEIRGAGFFPGSNGLIDSSQEVQGKEFMILGQDQDNEAGFNKSVKEGNEEYTPTWKNLLPLLNSANIQTGNCFFTNCLLGIRKNRDSNTGKSPSLKDTAFLKDCLSLLEFQINLQRPKAIICLGLIPITLLGYLSKDLHLKFILIEDFKEIDKRGLAVNKEIKFNSILDYRATIGVLTHPSFRRLNAKQRKFSGFVGNEAEIQILKNI